jgi:hypothetical protein
VPYDDFDPMSDEWKDFDLSALTYPEFLAFFFERPVVANPEQYELFRSGIDGFVASNPPVVVSHLQTMCRNYAQLTGIYSSEQLDQGLRAVFGVGISCERFLFDRAVSTEIAGACIESMYLPFEQAASSLSTDIEDTFFGMWWDMILHTFWEEYDPWFHSNPMPPDDQPLGTKASYREYTPPNYDDSSLLDERGKQMLEVLCNTLSKILEIPNRGCQLCALHGFGHLHSSRGSEIVQNYIDSHGHEFSSQELQWVEGCRIGKIV